MKEIGTPSRMGVKTDHWSAPLVFSRWRLLTKGKGAAAFIGLFLSMLLGLMVTIYPSAIGMALVATTVVVLRT